MGEPEVPPKGGSQWPPYSVWYFVTVILLASAPVEDWEAVNGLQALQALQAESSCLLNKVSWTAADTVGWIFLTILKANMDRTIGNAAPVLNVQRRLDGLEQCMLALQQEPCGPEEPSICDCEVVSDGDDECYGSSAESEV